MKSSFFNSIIVAASFFSGSIIEARLHHVALNSIIGRHADNSQIVRRLLDADDVDQDNLYQARGVQYADLKVGCPAQSQSAIISTASSAIGFPCSGCTNDCGEGSHLNGLYHEKLSTCFSEVACGDCLISSYSCTKKQCPVSLSYAEGSSWTGVEVSDMVSVGGEDSDEEAFPLRFGCQTDITGLFEDQIPDGIFGMNKEKGSAISQWSQLGYLEDSAFSLCYNVREDVKKKSGVMVLGGADERLHEKPMVFVKDVGKENYEVRIKQIKLQRGPGLSVSTSANNSVSLGLDGTDTAILDSATTCTYLNREWHDSLKEAWRQMTGGKYPVFSSLHITAQELDELPTIIFELEGEKDNETITIPYPPMRYMEKSLGGGYDFCMYASDSASSVALGNTFMSGHDVLHDLDNHRIGFAESKCEIITLQQQQPVGISVSTDADQVSKPLPNNKTKAIALQSEPVHKRKQNPATTPFMDFVYAFLALLAIVLVFVLYRRHKQNQDFSKDGELRSTTLWSFWTKPNTKHAYQLSCISLVVTVLAIIAGVVLFSSTGSSLFLVFGLENCVDFLSSAVVLWRFFAPSSCSKELELKLQSREQRASIAISIILVGLGVSIWITAIEDFVHGQEDPNQQNTAIIVSFVSTWVFGVLSYFKFHYAKALDSPSLYKDGICSVIGTTLSASLFVNTFIIKEAPAAWWIDPAVAICCGFASFIYGMQALYHARYKEGLPICSLKWWFLSQGDGDDGDQQQQQHHHGPTTSPTNQTVMKHIVGEDGEERFV